MLTLNNSSNVWTLLIKQMQPTIIQILKPSVEIKEFRNQNQSEIQSISQVITNLHFVQIIQICCYEFKIGVLSTSTSDTFGIFDQKIKIIIFEQTELKINIIISQFMALVFI